MSKPKNGDRALIVLPAIYQYGYWHLEYYEGSNLIPGVSEYSVVRIEPEEEAE